MIKKAKNINNRERIVRRKKALSFGRVLKKRDFLSRVPSIALILIMLLELAGGALLPFKFSLNPPSISLQEAQAAGEGWLSGWSYRRAITLSSATTVAYYQVQVQLTAANFDYTKLSFPATGDDLRFTGSDGTTLQDYWIETWSNGGTSTIWVEVATSGTSQIYMYYGNTSATTTTSNYDNTFAKDYGESGLAGLWHMDDGASPTIDSSGNGNNGTIYGATWAGSDGGQWNGRSDVNFSTGNSLQFDGVNDYVDVSGIGSYIASGSFTVSAFVKVNVYEPGLIQEIFRLGDAPSTNDIDFRIAAQGFEFHVYSGTRWNELYSGYIPQPSTWYHVIGVYNGSSGMQIYVNSILKKSNALTGRGAVAAATSYIGADTVPLSRSVNGTIDEVRIYNRALSAEEIYRLYIRSKYASPEPTVSLGSEEIPPASPTSATQLKNDESTVIFNQGYTNETNVKLKASATDANNPETLTLFFEAALNSVSFISPATPAVGTSCSSGTAWISCSNKIWYITSPSGGYTSTPYTGMTNVAGLSDAVAYKWQVKACDSGNACSSWVAYNATTPNFTVDTTAPAGGSFVINNDATYTSATSVTLNVTLPADNWTPIEIAYGNSASSTNWTTASTSVSHSLNAGDGTKTVYLRFRDSGGNTTTDITDTIILDTTVPDIAAVDAGASSTDRILLTSNTWFNYSQTGSDDKISFSWADSNSLSDDTFYYELNTTSSDSISGDEATTTELYIDGITISEGIFYFHAKPKNGAGTWGTERIFIVKYDKTAPTNVGISSITADSASQLTITALTASDTGSGLNATSAYWFAETSGNPGSSSSTDWQASTTSIDSGLSANTQYTYQVKAKDAVNNESSYSATSSKYTLAAVPSNLTLTADSQTQITTNWSANSNPAGTEYFVENVTAGTNSGWTTSLSWVSSGLSCGTSYSFKVKARNGNEVETAFTDLISVSTRGCPGGGMPPAWHNPPAAPKGGFDILINNGAEYTDTLTVTLNLQGGSDTARMAISNFPNFQDAGQEKYITIKEWNLCKGQENICEKLRVGELTSYEFRVYAKFYAPWGTVSVVVFDRIIYTPKTSKFPVEQEKEIPKEKPTLKESELPTGQVAKLPPPEVTPPTEKPPKPPIIERVPEILKPLIPEFLKPKPPEVKPPEVPIEELVPKEAPLAFQGKWQLLSSKPIREFVLAPLPKEIRKLAEKFPKLEKTLEEVGISKITDVAKLKTVKLTLPGLTERVGPEGVPLGGTLRGKFALPKAIPIAKLSPQMKKQLPSEIVFAKTGGELIDFNIALTVSDKGEPQQKINTISGKPLQLVVKPDKPVKSVKGYVVFKSKQKRVGLLDDYGLASYELENNRQPVNPPTHNKIISKTEISLNSLLASVFFVLPSFAKTHDPIEIETRLVLLEFKYTDPDGDGIYTAEIQAPLVEGEYEIITVMDFEDPESGPEGKPSVSYGVNKKEIRLITVVDPEGYIYTTLPAGKLRIAGAIVSIYWLNPEIKQYEPWPAKEYQQENPQTTDDTGKYSFLVPPGTYYLRVEHPNYPIYQSETFVVKEGSGIHMNIELKTKFWWLKIIDWKIAVIILFGIFLAYNFYRDKIRERLLRKPKTYEPR